MNPNASQLRDMRRQNLAWPPALVPVPAQDWPVARYEQADLAPRIAAWRSRQFLVQAFEEPNGITRLSVNRTDWDERQKRFREDIGWDDLQRLKAEAGFADRVAFEVFPPDDLIVNVANMRHLWVLPEGALPGIVWGSTRRKPGRTFKLPSNPKPGRDLTVRADSTAAIDGATRVRTKAADLVTRHASRLDMDDFAANLLVDAILSIPVETPGDACQVNEGAVALRENGGAAA